MSVVIIVYCFEEAKKKHGNRGNFFDKWNIFYMSTVYYKIQVFVAFLLFLHMY